MSTPQYRFATIMSADLVGFARLTAANTEHTATLLLTLQRWMSRLVRVYGGRVVDIAGDGLLAEFSQEEPALFCAAAVQRVLADFNRGRAASDELQLRIGLHTGTLLALGHRVFGDPVNIAARLQSEAPSGGVIASTETVRHTSFDLAGWAATGPRLLKNIPYPVTAWRAPAELFHAKR
jgi:class 3 adenylate cyclase